MKVKRLVLVLGLALLVMTAGCAGDSGGNETNKSENVSSSGGGNESSGSESGGNESESSPDDVNATSNATSIQEEQDRSWLNDYDEENDTLVSPNDSLSTQVFAADEGETVYVKNGLYKGGVFVNKDVKIVGQNESRVEILRDQNKRGIWVNEDANLTVENVTISGFTGAGIYLSENRNGFRISNVTVSNSKSGVFARKTTGNWVIKDSKITDNDEGVMVHNSKSKFLINRSDLVNNTEHALYSPGTTRSWKVNLTNITNNGRGVLTNGKSPNSEPTILRSNIHDNGVAVDSDNPRTYNPLVAKKVYWGQREGPTEEQIQGYIEVVDPCPQPNRRHRTWITCKGTIGRGSGR